ncbi:hypothetical protein [Enterococcus pallens]|uniref:Uncharacterized protein n=1 Tax=Enterococcus pallens ATCC BAA-351 TaxID=1158607 RepID=R2Q3E6_9ENTE|nr:hypothetical protein [Enterococcus pallens]EOH91082.1 hypothetical protein UAU_03621 [Enterococcus pallens ATCC BAA-351]EOU16279.1 hypothetical protein I588_03935 [Enterococcus pallens ATCC BAA-351]OJG78979.1 hypothetical protein RV10_GL001102 [Enterococcus pallens]
MNSEQFAELEEYVQTLAFQVGTLRKQQLTVSQKQSLQQLEADYQQYKTLYDQAVAEQKSCQIQSVQVKEEW